MRKSLLVYLIAGICIFTLKHSSAQTININGIEREYLLHIPDQVNGDENLAVIIMLHHLGSNAEHAESYTQFSKKADQEGFMVVYPQGLGNSWNAGGCCSPSMDDNVEDIEFISQLIDTLIENYPIDTAKVFVAGFSNGAILAYALASEISHKIDGVAAAGGLLALVENHAAVPIPIIHFHALNDVAVDIDGMWGFPSVYDMLAEWQNINGIIADPDTFRDDNKIQGILYPSPDSSANIILYTSETGGHNWQINKHLGTTNRIWEFFSTGINKIPVSRDTIMENSRKRDFKVHIPADYQTSVEADKKYPLVLAAHGWNDNTDSMEEMTQFSDLADKKDFFVAYLHYVGPPPDYSWNYYMYEDKPDDIGYVKEVIDSLFTRFPIDSNQIFAIGFSDGCGLINRLPFETNGLISATGTVGGMITFADSVATNPVRMIHFHAKGDPAVSYNSVRNTSLDYWLEVNNALSDPDTLLNVSNYFGEVFTNTEGDSVILFYTLPWYQHNWPVKDVNGMKLSPSELMWDFFSTGMAIPEIESETPQSDELKLESEEPFKAFPNPATNYVQFSILSEIYEQLSLSIFDPSGRMLISEARSVFNGENMIRLETGSLPEGYYFLQIKGNHFTHSMPIKISR